MDFSGQDIYIGLDTHKKQITATILGEHLSHKTFSQNPDPGILFRYLNRNFPGASYYAAYEAGFSGFWLQESLQELGVNCIVVNAADVPTKDKERKQKRDPMDSRKIARSLRNGELDAIYVPSKTNQHDRSLVRPRDRLVGNLTRCKNRIKSQLSFFGVAYPEVFAKSGTHWSKKFMTWLKKIDLEGNSGNVSLRTFIEEAEFLRKLLLKTTREIREKKKKLYKHDINTLTTKSLAFQHRRVISQKDSEVYVTYSSGKVILDSSTYLSHSSSNSAYFSEFVSERS